LGISTFPPGTFGVSHFTARWTEKRRFPTVQPSSKTINFRCRRDKKLVTNENVI